MADFKAALTALSKGELTLEALLVRLDAVLEESPDEIKKALQQVQEAYKQDTIDADSYLQIKNMLDQIMGNDDSDEDYGYESDEVDSDPTMVVNVKPDEDDDATVVASGKDFSDAKTEVSPTPVQDEPSSPSSNWPTDSATTNASTQPSARSSVIGPGAIIKERFRLDEVLGVGGMGTVYKGVDLLKVEARDRNPYVALKVLNEDFKQHPDSFIALQREASRQQKLAHPNIATVYDFDRTGGNVYITMELLEGTPINEFIKKTVRPKGGLPFEEAYRITEGLGKALIYAHEHHIVHSDFKPGNCFITNKDEMKVLDFGIARAVKTQGQAEGDKTLFDPGKLGALTPAYASAEMLDGKDPDPRDDIYALACVTYELLCGKHPFNKLPANTARENNLEPAPIKGLKRRQMKGLARGLAFDREDRSQNVQQFLNEFEGASNPLKNPFVIAGISVIMLILIGIIPLRNHLHDKEIQQLIDNFHQGDETSIANLLQQLPLLNDTDKQLVKSEVRDTVIEHFQNKANKYLDGSKSQYDYPGAERVLGEARLYYPDSAKMQQILSKLNNDKLNLLSELTERFNENLSENRILQDPDTDDIGDVLQIVAEVDPVHAMLDDRRIPGAFANAIETALDSQDFELATTYLNTGLSMVPKDVSLVNLQDRINAEIEKAEHRRMISDLENILTSNAVSVTTLDDAAQYKDDILALTKLTSESPVLQQLSDQLRNVVTDNFNQISENREWSTAEIIISTQGDLLKALNMGDLFTELQSNHQKHIEQLDSLSSGISKAIALHNLDGDGQHTASAQLQQLQEIAPEDERTARAQQQISQAYLKQARLARAGSQWQTSREQIIIARSFNPDEALIKSLDDELAEVDRLEMLTASGSGAEELAKLAEQRQQHINSLHDVYNEQIKQGEFKTLADSYDVLNTIEQLEIVAPADPLVSHGRTQIADVLSATALEQSQTGQHDQALALFQDTLAKIPETQSFTDRLSLIQQGRDAAILAEQQRQIDDLIQQADKLLENPVLDREWEAQLAEILDDLSEFQVEDNQRMINLKTDIAMSFITRAQKLRETQNFTRATGLLERATTYQPDLPALAQELQAVQDAENAFVAQRKEEERLARIEGLKQTLLTQAKARKISKAKVTLQALKKELPANDTFITDDAATALGDAYYQLALEKAKDGSKSTALKLAKAGLKVAPDMQNLKQLIRDYTIESNSQWLKKEFQEIGSLNFRQTYLMLKEIKNIDLANYRQLEATYALKLAAYYNEAKDIDAKQANKTLANSKKLFPEHGALAKLEPVKLVVPVTPKPKPKTADKSPEKAVAKTTRKKTKGVSGRDCEIKYAGYGRRKKGTCYDSLSGKARGPYLVVVPSGGEFSRSFAISKYEISVRDWNYYCKLSGNCSANNDDDKNQPINNLTLEQANYYTTWLSEVTGHTYRLPTASEWEYAANAGGKQPKKDHNCRVTQGSKIIKGQSLVTINTGKPNGWGLYNYIGNVQEWVTTPSGTKVRGGAFNDALSKCDIALEKDHNGSSDESTGLRLIMEM